MVVGALTLPQTQKRPALPHVREAGRGFVLRDCRVAGTVGDVPWWGIVLVAWVALSVAAMVAWGWSIRWARRR